jgi:predicted nucleic acid-binding protein
MYLVGAPHPNRDEARRLLERCIGAGTRLVTDAEVLQEILHRYVAIDRRAAIQPAYDAILDVIDEVLAVELPDVQRAKEIVLGNRRLSARDALHAAVMERHHITQILTFDEGFDAIPGLARIG